MALDAILAEWTSADSYALRISKITSGVGAGGYALNSSTVTPDASANTVSDGSSPTASTWLIAHTTDNVQKKSGETQTTI